MKSLQSLSGLRQQQDRDFHKRQADHNLGLAEALFARSKEGAASDPKYFDWVITIGFYAALHYIRCALAIEPHCIFYERTFQNKTFDEVVAYRRSRKNENQFPSGAAFSKHDILKKIVEESFPAINADYHLLHMAADTARYKQYRAATLENAEDELGRARLIKDWFYTVYGTHFLPK